MNLKEYKTPIVDANKTDGWSGDAVVCPSEVARELEQKLAAAIDFISRVPYVKWQYIESGEMAVDAIELLKEIQ